jgi:hypothetical protein
MNRRQIAARAGMLASAIFVLTFTVEGYLRPGYDPLRMYISELSLGPRGWVQITSFIIVGALLLIFAWGVKAEFREGKASRFGPLLFIVIGLGFLLSGPAVMDPVITRPDQMTTSGLLHGIFGAIVFTLIPIVCWVFVRRFQVDPKWRSLYGWTLGVAIITTAATIALSVATKPPLAPNILTEWDGLIQRFLIAPFHAWVFVFASALNRKS